MAATESDMPYEVGLIKQGRWEMISKSHPAVLNLDHLFSDNHEGEEEEGIVRLAGQRSGSPDTWLLGGVDYRQGSGLSGTSYIYSG